MFRLGSRFALLALCGTALLVGCQSPSDASKEDPSPAETTKILASVDFSSGGGDSVEGTLSFDPSATNQGSLVGAIRLVKNPFDKVVRLSGLYDASTGSFAFWGQGLVEGDQDLRVSCGMLGVVKDGGIDTFRGSVSAIPGSGGGYIYRASQAKVIAGDPLAVPLVEDELDTMVCAPFAGVWTTNTLVRFLGDDQEESLEGPFGLAINANGDGSLALFDPATSWSNYETELVEASAPTAVHNNIGTTNESWELRQRVIIQIANDDQTLYLAARLRHRYKLVGGDWYTTLDLYAPAYNTSPFLPDIDTAREAGELVEKANDLREVAIVRQSDANNLASHLVGSWKAEDESPFGDFTITGTAVTLGETSLPIVFKFNPKVYAKDNGSNESPAIEPAVAQALVLQHGTTDFRKYRVVLRFGVTDEAETLENLGLQQMTAEDGTYRFATRDEAIAAGVKAPGYIYTKVE